MKELGVLCTEDSVTKTNDGGLASMHKERKVVWVYPSSDKIHCLVRLIDKYMSLLPPVRNSKKSNFYLRSLERVTPAQWFGEQVVGLNTLKKTINFLAESANLEGYFTNHSLRHSGTTLLFQAGVDRKLIKEFTEHASDAVDKYQIMSHQQRKHLSAMIGGEIENRQEDNVDKFESCDFEFSVGETRKNVQCTCKNKVLNINEFDKLGKMISDVIEKKKKGRKATVCLSIEFDC